MKECLSEDTIPITQSTVIEPDQRETWKEPSLAMAKHSSFRNTGLADEHALETFMMTGQCDLVHEQWWRVIVHSLARASAWIWMNLRTMPPRYLLNTWSSQIVFSARMKLPMLNTTPYCCPNQPSRAENAEHQRIGTMTRVRSARSADAGPWTRIRSGLRDLSLPVISKSLMLVVGKQSEMEQIQIFQTNKKLIYILCTTLLLP